MISISGYNGILKANFTSDNYKLIYIYIYKYIYIFKHWTTHSTREIPLKEKKPYKFTASFVRWALEFCSLFPRESSEFSERKPNSLVAPLSWRNSVEFEKVKVVGICRRFPWVFGRILICAHMRGNHLRPEKNKSKKTEKDTACNHWSKRYSMQPLSITNSQSSLRLTSIESVMPSSHKFEQIPGVGDGQGSLACCSPWGHKESDTTEWLNWADHNVKAVNSSRGQKDTMNLVTKYQSRRSNKW